MMVNYLNKIFEMQQDFVNLDPSWEILEGYPNFKDILEKIEEGEDLDQDDLSKVQKPTFSTYPEFYTKDFESQEKLFEYVNDPDYGKVDGKGEICLGFEMVATDESDKAWKLRLYVSDNRPKKGWHANLDT